MQQLVRSTLWATRGAIQRATVAMALSNFGLRRACQNLQEQQFSSQPVSNKHAAVLVPLFQDPSGDIFVVLTQRSSRLPTHSGEVCLPGGKRDPGDADDVATALREAHEELGIDPSAVSVVGRLPPFLSKHLLSVTPVVGTIPPDLPLRPNRGEVASVFTAPLRMFVEGGPMHYTRDVEWEAGVPYRLHYFKYVHAGQQFLIWGLTAGILIVAAEKAFGRPASFQVSPPGARPYTDLTYDGRRLAFRQLSTEEAAAALVAAAASDRQGTGAAGHGVAAQQPRMAAALHTAATSSNSGEEGEGRSPAATL